MTISNAAVYEEPKIETEEPEVSGIVSDRKSYNGELG